MSKPEPSFTVIAGRDFRVARSLIVCRGVVVVLLFCAAVVSTLGQTPVLTQHNDNARTGQNTSETILNTTNVNLNQFGKIFAVPADGQVYAQPLYVPGVTINGGVHNVVIIATENDTVYAYDADSNGAPLWKVSMVDIAHGAGMGETALDSATTIGCSDMQPQIGITSTPVIDSTSKTIYVEAKSTDGTNYFHRLHALDLLTGSEKVPGPVVIAATVSGTGDGSSNGQLVFNSNTNALHLLNRPGLLLLNGTIYIAYGSHCDASPWHGWLFAYDAGTFTRKSVYVTTPNGGMGGFWMTGAGIAADASGNIFIASGNGDFDTTNVPATETGDTILKLGTTNQVLTLLDYFTPFNQLNLDNTDTDLGSGGVVLLPDQPGPFPHILVQAGKEGRIYVVNRDQMTTNNSHYCSGCANDPEIIEETGRNAAGIGEGMFNTAAYWNNTLYFWGVQDVLQSIPITNGLPDFTHGTGSSPQIGLPGAGVSVSSNGTTAGSAILWAIDSSQFGLPGPAVLYAYDATNILTMLYSSSGAQNVARDTAGNAVKFAVPTVVNGKVYVGTSTEVDVYGLLSANPPPSISSIAPSNAVAGGPSFQLTVNGTGFAAGATVNFGSSPAITPSSINSTQVVATIPAADIATAGAVNVTVTNVAGGGTSNALTFTINPAPTAPAITSANTATFTVGTLGNFTVTTTGSPTPSLTETGALPSPVTFKDNGNGTATLSGTPAAGTAGSYPITIKASNGVGTAATQSFTLTVNGGGGGGSGFAYVAGSVTGVNNWGSTSGTTVSVALHQIPKAGDLLLCAANWQSGTATASMSDPNNGTWTPIGAAKAGIATNAAFSGQMFYVPSAVSTSTTVTFTVSKAVAFRAFECAEYSYSGTIAFDGTPQYSTTPATKGVATISGLTTSNSNDLVFAACLGVTTTCTTGSGYTGLDDKNTFNVTSGTFGNSWVGLNGQMIQYKIAAATGAQSATFGTGTANDDVTLGLVAMTASQASQAPSISSANSTAFAVGTAGSFTVTTTGSPTPSLTESGALPSPVTFKDNGNGTATLSGTPAAGTAGSYPITITASNGVGTAATQSFTLTVNQAPVITSANATTFTVGTAGTFTVTTTGSPTPALTETGALPSPVTFKDNGNGTATLSGTPAAGTAGSYPITITASNGVGTAAIQSFTLTVASNGTPPAITSANSTAFTVGTAGSFTVTTTGSPTPSLTETGALPSLVTFKDNGNGTATLSGTPATGTAGSYPITIKASNGVGTAATQSFTLTVNQAPAITSANNTAFTVGTAGSFTVTTTGSPTPSLTETGALPSPVTFKDNGNGTATLSGTPAAGTAASYPITIKASNGVGTAATQSFTLTVNGGGGGGSNFAYVAGSVTGVNNWGSTSGTTVSVALHQIPKAGDLLLCAANWQSGTATASMSDPNNGTWTPIGAAKAGIATNAAFSGQMFYVPSAASTSTTVTLTVSKAVAFRAFECAEYSYSGTIAFDGTPQYSTTPASGGVATISGLTTSNSNDLVFAACLGVTTTCTTGSGYTGLDDKNTFNVTSGTFGNSFVGLNGQMIQYKIAAAAGAQSATFGTGTATDDVTLGLVAF